MLNVSPGYSKYSSETIICPVARGYITDRDIHLPTVKGNITNCVNSGTTILIYLLHSNTVSINNYSDKLKKKVNSLSLF